MKLRLLIIPVLAATLVAGFAPADLTGERHAETPQWSASSSGPLALFAQTTATPPFIHAAQTFQIGNGNTSHAMVRSAETSLHAQTDSVSDAVGSAFVARDAGQTVPARGDPRNA
jgi:hypothetical protein